jgi:flavin-binding protein dodecin
MVWKCIDIVGESPESFAKAVENAVAESAKTVKQMQWFEVTSLRGTIQNGRVAQFQAIVKIGFKVER